MARKVLAVGTQVIAQRTMGTVMPSGEDAVVSVVFQVSAASSLSTIPAVAVEESGIAPSNIQYVNILTGNPVAAGTPITANGIYGVYAPGCVVSLVTSAGSATVEAQRVYGRVF
jgi:hypothetical protein